MQQPQKQQIFLKHKSKVKDIIIVMLMKYYIMCNKFHISILYGWTIIIIIIIIIIILFIFNDDNGSQDQQTIIIMINYNKNKKNIFIILNLYNRWRITELWPRFSVYEYISIYKYVTI